LIFQVQQKETGKMQIELKEIEHWDSARRLFKTAQGLIYGFYKSNGQFKTKELVKPDMSNAEWFRCSADGEPSHPITWKTDTELKIKELTEVQ